MIRTKHMVILAVAVAVLAGISIGQKAGHRKATSRPASAVLLDGTWTADDVARIALGLGEEDEVVVLERTPDGWILPTAWNARASVPKIEAVLKILSGLTGEFRSDRADVMADYGLTSEGKLTIRVGDAAGAEVVALDVGGSPDGAQGQFVHRPGTNAVYLSGANVLSALGLYGGPARPASRHFLDLQAVQEDKNAVDRITLQDEHGERTLTKVFAAAPAAGDSAAAPEPDRLTWEWTLSGAAQGAAQKTKADGVLGAAVAVRAVDVDDPGVDPAVYGLAEPARRAVLGFADGRELVLSFGAERAAADGKPAGVWMRVGDDPTVWVATAYAANNIFKTAADLLPGS